MMSVYLFCAANVLKGMAQWIYNFRSLSPILCGRVD